MRKSLLLLSILALFLLGGCSSDNARTTGTISKYRLAQVERALSKAKQEASGFDQRIIDCSKLQDDTKLSSCIGNRMQHFQATLDWAAVDFGEAARGGSSGLCREALQVASLFLNKLKTTLGDLYIAAENDDQQGYQVKLDQLLRLLPQIQSTSAAYSHACQPV